MPSTHARIYFSILLGVSVAACDLIPDEWDVPPGAEVYQPGNTEGIVPDIKTDVFVSANVVRDEITGAKIFREIGKDPYRDFGDAESGIKTVYRLDREGQPAVLVVTRSLDLKGKRLGWSTSVTEILHASEDGFFPFENALYPADLSLERVAAMIDLQGASRSSARGATYLDNRESYRARNQQLARARAERKVRVANFDFDPLEGHDAPVYEPSLEGYSYDPSNGVSTAPEGSTLSAKEVVWKTNLGRSGEHFMVHATWTSADGALSLPITIKPHRAYREGHGETRGAQLFVRSGGDAESERLRRTAPEGKILAGLINANGRIAGPHRGQMVVIDSRGYRTEWR